MRNIDIVLVDGFPMLSATLVTEPLRLANRESLEQVFAWRFLSVDGGMQRSSSGFEVTTDRLDDRPADAVLLLSSYHPEAGLRHDMLAWLRRRARRGDLMGCVDTGALIFAAAGLLGQHSAAAHFEAIDGFVASYPKAMFVDRLFDFSPPRCSSAGGVATFDMTLALIAHMVSADIASRAAQIMNYLPTGHTGEQQRLSPMRSLGMVNQDLALAIDIMLGNLSAPLPIAQIAQRAGLPGWRLGRLFQRYLRQSPAQYYLGLRLARARNLLRNSHRQVGIIASLCGFDNHETFTRAYRRQFKLAPSADREY
ncbi:MAG: helix-turn-helix domain-containing protein [Burkholderiaceae bacterium]